MTTALDISIAQVLDTAAPVVLDLLAEGKVPARLHVSPTVYDRVEELHDSARVAGPSLLGLELVRDGDVLPGDAAVY